MPRGLRTLPLSSATRNLMDARRVRLLQPTAFVINVARAEIFDETALYDALASRHIAGAALDVWYRYLPRLVRPCRQHVLFMSLKTSS